MEVKVLNCEIMSWFCFNHLNTPPYCLVKLSSLICVDGVFWYTKHVHYTLVWI
jgi:hypothetical protein